jgi:hypothetical protein
VRTSIVLVTSPQKRLAASTISHIVARGPR